MQPNLKPEAVAALRQMVDDSRALTQALAALVNQPSREFKADPGHEYIDRSQAMDRVLAIRDAHYRLCETARQSVIALGVSGTGHQTFSAHTPMGGSKAE
ncbi:MAG: hypothetical protein K0S48_21 [Ramlibacter sp.]|jgi:hypothetical protein|nr:hypothetical protein [Ramlibacter sp.]